MYCVIMHGEKLNERYCPICNKFMNKSNVEYHVKSKQHISKMELNNIIENVTTERRSFELYTINNKINNPNVPIKL